MRPEDEVWQLIQALNRLWTVEGKPEALRNYFHRDMVVIDPINRLRTEGGAAAVAGWTQFAVAATTHYWREREPQVQFHGDGNFAIVTYYYEMAYDMDGRRIESSGRDMMALVREDGRWWVVADQFSPFPGEPA